MLRQSEADAGQDEPMLTIDYQISARPNSRLGRLSDRQSFLYTKRSSPQDLLPEVLYGEFDRALL